MKYRRLFMSAVCLIGVFMFIGQANAIRWYGFSGLCFEGEFKGTKDSLLEITLVDVTVHAQCYNINTEGTCQPGVGNAGDITIGVDALADPEKIKGTLNADGCISLEKWDNHQSEDHQHICWPRDNTNKWEVEGSAYIPEIKVEWVLKNAANDKVIRRGFQACYWPGTIDPDTCLPDDVSHGLEFVCTIDDEFKK